MKSDREFLDGIYEKAANNNKQTKKQPVNSYKYIKYAGMAAGFLLVISSALYINKDVEKNQHINNQPVPSKVRMISYIDNLIDKATDIIVVKAKHENNNIALSITKSYKSSGIEIKALNYFNNDVIGLTVDQSAVIFIDADSKDAPVIDIFVWEPDSDGFVNPYGEIITEEILNNLN